MSSCTSGAGSAGSSNSPFIREISMLRTVLMIVGVALVLVGGSGTAEAVVSAGDSGDVCKTCVISGSTASCSNWWGQGPYGGWAECDQTVLPCQSYPGQECSSCVLEGPNECEPALLEVAVTGGAADGSNRYFAL